MTPAPVLPTSEGPPKPSERVPSAADEAPGDVDCPDWRVCVHHRGCLPPPPSRWHVPVSQRRRFGGGSPGAVDLEPKYPFAIVLGRPVRAVPVVIVGQVESDHDAIKAGCHI